MASQYSLPADIGKDHQTSVLMKLVCPTSTGATRSTSPVPTKWTTGWQSDLTVKGVMWRSPLIELIYVADRPYSGCPGLHSAECGDLFVPRTRTTRLGRGSFFITAPVVWNSLLLHLRSLSISHSQFRAGLKTHLFRLAFHWLYCWTVEEIELNWTDE